MATAVDTQTVLRTSLPRMTAKTMTRTRPRSTVTVVVATAAMAVIVCTAVADVTAITTKPSGTSVIKTTLQILPSAGGDTTAATNDDEQQPSFAARYWQQQRDFENGPSIKTYGDDDGENDDFPAPFPPHKLSAVQQEHILDDVRRHNQQQQQWWTGSEPSTSTASSRTSAKATTDAGDQFQELLRINGVAAADDGAENHDDERHGRQRSASNGGGVDGWLPQSPPPQFFNNYNGRQPPQPQQPQQQQQQQPPLLSPYFPPPTASVTQQQPQYYPSTTSPGPVVQPYNQHRNHPQQPQFYVTTPQSPVVDDHYDRQRQPQTYYPQRPVATPTFGPPPPSPSTTAVAAPQRTSGSVDDIDAALEEQIRQQLTAVAGSANVNYTILNAANGGAIDDRPLHQHVVDPASGDGAQYVQIGGGPSPSSRNRGQQPQQSQRPNVVTQGSPIAGGKNTVVKTVVIRQKPPPPPPPPKPAAVEPPAPAAAATEQQHSWTVSEQQQLEQLARQVLPPGVAQYEIIRAGGGGAGGTATPADNAVPVGGGPAAQQPSAAGKKKPVTFVILEERPDGTVRVRGVEKKQPGDAEAAADAGSAADDEQLQQLVDKLNKGELRLPSAGAPSRLPGADSAGAASTTAAAPLPAFVQQPSPAATPPSVRARNPPAASSPYFPAATPQTVADAPHRDPFPNSFLPTVLPTASVATTTAGMAGQQQHRYRPPQQHRPAPPAVVAAATSTTPPAPVNLTLPFFNNNYNSNNNNNNNNNNFNSNYNGYKNNNKNTNAVVSEGKFSGALRRRGYYAMAKYMRQAGIDAVLEETGPFTIFVPTDKAFRALLVQLGGPDRAEDKFRENPRLLIGLLLHHVVPGAFKAADLKAGDEMTGVSLAGTQLRANLYARQLYDNRWNDIEVLTVNGARVLEDVGSASTGVDDGYLSTDDNAGGSVQQRRDMVLSSNDGGERGGSTGDQQIVAIGHAVDRVLFPLPVGDVLATMRADRQRRYSVFLRAVDELCSPNVRSLLSGSRTVTVFAPVDEAFRVRHGSSNHSGSGSGSIADGLFRDDGGVGRLKKRNRRRAADRFVLSHVVLAGPGDPPMYTAGLRFYQVRDTAYRLPEGGGDPAGVNGAGGEEDGGGTAEDGTGGWDDGRVNAPPPPPPADGENPRYYQLTVYKDSGRIRLNGGVAQVLVRNVPATNGVLHGIDAPLV